MGGGGCTFSEGEEYVGNDIKVVEQVAAKDACCALCASLSACKFFTYDKRQKRCSMKSENAPDTSRPNPDCTSGFIGSNPPAPRPPAEVNVAVIDRAVSTTEEAYACWNLDTSRNRQFFDRNLSQADPLGAQLARQAAALGSANQAGYSILRFGGTGNDYLTYAVGGAECPPQSEYNECLNTTWWANTLAFTRAAKAKMVFGLSLNTGHDRRAGRGLLQFPQVWNSSNARALLQWTIKQGSDDLLFGFELGNEQNSKYSGATIARNFAILHNLTVELWPDKTRRPRLIGPDPHSFKQDGVEAPLIDWMEDFMRTAKELEVPIYAVTHHEYIEVDSTSFTSPNKLDVTKVIAVAVNASVASILPGVQAWAGEVGPHNGGSPPCDHTTMRWANFGDSLWYADAMAAKARHGYGAFCRQDYIGADYGLVDCSTGTPLPDFWTALVWGTTMGSTVLDASVQTPHSTAIRAYAHCAAHHKGAVTVLLINLASVAVNVSLTLPGASDSQLEFHLEQVASSSVLYNATGLLGTKVSLNGQLLQLEGDGKVPSLQGMQSLKTDVVHLAAESVAFVTLSNHHFAAC